VREPDTSGLESLDGAAGRPAGELVPHQGAALLLDRIESADAGMLTASLTVRPGTAFSNDDGSLAGWAGPEIMAQAVSAFSTLTSGREGGPAIGLLLGARDYRSRLNAFPAGTRLEVSVTESTRDQDGGGVFDCCIRLGAEIVADGRLTVFEPVDPWAILQAQSG